MAILELKNVLDTQTVTPASTQVARLRAPSPDALSITASLLPLCGQAQTCAVLVVAPVEGGGSWFVAQQLAEAFQHRLDGPVLVLGLAIGNGKSTATKPVSTCELSSSVDLELSIELSCLDRDDESEPIFANLTFSAKELAVILSSGKFEKILDKLRPRFKAVLIAASAFAECSASLLAAQLSDGVIFSVRQAESTLRSARNAQALAARVHSKVVGFILESPADSTRK
jgi:hypothetical protein